MSAHTLKGPSDGETVGIIARAPGKGNETELFSINSTTYFNYKIIIDSGSSQNFFPRDILNNIYDAILDAWKYDDKAVQIIESILATMVSNAQGYNDDATIGLLDDVNKNPNNMTELGADFYQIFVEKRLSLPMSSDDADFLNSLVPDIVIRGLEGGDLVSDGSNLLYEWPLGSGFYMHSINSNTADSIQLGDPFLVNKTLTYAVNGKEDGKIGILSDTADCESSYGEKGFVVEFAAVEPLFQTGVYAANITYGGQEFSVQLDTGSPHLA